MCFTMNMLIIQPTKRLLQKLLNKVSEFMLLFRKGNLGKMDLLKGLIEQIKITCLTKFSLSTQKTGKYQLKLWEMEYNFQRPHQGIDNLTPIQKAQKQHPIWTKFAFGYNLTNQFI